PPERGARGGSVGWRSVGRDTLGGGRPRNWPGGGRQRRAPTAAPAREPGVLLLDERTASLDPAATKAIEDVIRLIAGRGIKVVMATHDLGEAKRLAGDIVLLDRGRVVEHGDAAAFFAAPKTDAARKVLAGELLV